MSRFIAWFIVCSVLFFLAGCDDDPAASTSTTGTLIIDGSPMAVSFDWTLTHPDDSVTRGSGDKTLQDMAPGPYTIAWGDVAGWTTPSNESRTLVAGRTEIFAGLYLEIVTTATGTIIIDPSPDVLDAPWLLSGPQSVTGNGDRTLTEMTIGFYTITWDDVQGWIKPFPRGKALEADSTLIFGGIYAME
jgi:hypothetical protein